jgi:hypothetical protein
MIKHHPDPDFLDELIFEPLTQKNWDKFVQLFGKNGACGNCWCMYYRLSKAEYLEGKAEEVNKHAMQEIVRANKQADGKVLS